ncbi:MULTISPECIES: pyridoxamine 5'-phosphate oxidase family protein [unclassified Ensifer]|uniref:2Fe-2S iron-sulfur cluster-binding protein n=1 Tax=unclassified Ensifer TaxID=2633371 RepID=UPI0008137B61|nr:MULTISPECIES: pyridoxamine 5'-phosphate oxidase family protein [unclassified Ensifer]OCP16055.1 FAD-binding oxidoreductase [Ensifer sp. LC384]OCP20124.1 FAD-binding oxidoreductase [Ensifer sp. LC54]OCP35555.1 FAD-binding oxidoreductase [Ensifer sp. LC163]
MPDTIEPTRAASPWHEGELAIQHSLGVVDRMDAPGRNFVRTFMPEQHQQFYPLLPFIVLGTVDPAGDVWASLRAGEPGFMQAPDAHALDVQLPRDRHDPADIGMEDGAAIAMLGIQLETRRRNRLNGTIRRMGDDRFAVTVGQSFGNCPQYIQLRDFSFVRQPNAPPETRPIHLNGLDARAKEIIANADTFFVASYVDRDNGERQVDVSHRGGRTGFVRIGEDGVLTIPDFAGNLFFNTLGNFMLNPKAGLLFVDFTTGDMLQMTGEAEVVLASPEIDAFQGAERLWRFRPRQVVYRPDGSPLRWSFGEAGRSPNSLMTGDWQQTEDRLRAAARAGEWRPFRVIRTQAESTTIRSLHLEPADDAGLVPFRAGQHLSLRINSEGKPVVRSYTLSAAPSDGAYRISVKRDGAGSSFLHGLVPGDVIEARAPAGSFVIDATERRPAVLLAAGVGITPMIAMVRDILYEGLRKRRIRPTWLFQSARSLDERAFDQEIASLVDTGQGKIHLTRVLSQTDGARIGEDYDAAGRIDIPLLQSILPFGDYDFYLCGPRAFMQSLYDGLRALNVADARIHAETFGLSSLTRSLDAGLQVSSKPQASTPVRVIFAASGKEARWQPGQGTLLDLAEARGLSPEYGCRNGSCGSCSTRVLEGEVVYPQQPSFEVRQGEALICCAVPAEDDGRRLQLAV